MINEMTHYECILFAVANLQIFLNLQFILIFFQQFREKKNSMIIDTLAFLFFNLQIVVPTNNKVQEAHTA